MNAHHDNAPLYRRFVDLLHRTIGLDAASLGHSTIERAVDQRAAAWYADGHADATLADYWEAAQASPSLVQALVETVVVPETWFYRDADAFRALARLAHERLDERGTALPLRILSLPCSTGEEPYTIAMTLLDAGIDAAHMRIDAMDISERSLAFAQRAVYTRNSFRGNAFPFRDAHFTRTEDGWRLAPRIADTVRFSRANLMQLDATALGVYDFVFCRNVLIYFDREAQQTALHALNGVLAENGTLFVGPAETGLLMRYGMQSAKIPLAFAFHRATPAEARLNGWHTAPLATAAAALAMTHSPMPALAPLQVFSAEPFAWPDPVARTPFGDGSPQTPFNGISQRTPKLSTTVPQPHEFMSPPVASPTNAARDTLQAAHALADAGRLVEAANAINAYLEHHAPQADAFYLLGVLADAGGDTNLARGQYRKALYLDPQHGEALAHLATLLALEGDRNGARLLIDRAARAQGAQRG
ncbi:chemotaxis protein CheR [Burkholderia sp. R-69980]|jgi:Methylase of chemotaxis methyl-accepting proteins|uniref:CheR family methyltransferase n=1 Tax=Paraburkholderia domus TaxID=2793075 RepID=UPI001913E5C0|nr:protein-glutamate O-methyltransferase CheR [Paraburkholderia domus]MBK5047728.1 chemotaxis protein CheR [Burkholderia sp. R-70006]MBK5119898.1 chemotaxis protein CheR [Burkholderia sp. R-69980]CAE6689079.1 putative biofilm formation methyltransferase WspC [Paraburkholderia domus]CAE6927026.1 putative biofilm formation methyltransferase WspC [Paraburkholderia domus]